MSSSESQAEVHAAPIVSDLPESSGKYTLVGLDVDTTGRRLIDEIVQLAAYTPEKQYAQYIMPYMNLNPAARQRHQMRVITIGFYRMLKCMQTSKVIKSKSEIAALNDFLDWIEELLKSDADSEGVIFIYHEERKFIPYMIMEAIKKYNLFERFSKSVKLFANGYEFAKLKCDPTNFKNFGLRSLSSILPETAPADSNDNGKQNVSGENVKENFEGSASVRAKLAFEVAIHLSKSEQPTQDVSSPLTADFDFINILRSKCDATSVDKVLEELEVQAKNIERQNSFRPVFLAYFRTTLFHRVKAVKYRIVLAESGYDLETLNGIWADKKKDGLSAVIKEISGLSADDQTELIELFDSFFDPDKPSVKLVAKQSKRKPKRSRSNKENSMPLRSTKDTSAGGDNSKSNIVDSTIKSPSKPIRSRNNTMLNKTAGKVN